MTMIEDQIISDKIDTAKNIGGIKTITMGCRLNFHETEAMKNAASGLADDEIILVNTCAVTAEAVRQAKQAIRRARRENPNAKIIVSGCAAQIEPETFAQMPEIDRVIGNTEKTKPETYLKLRNTSERILVDDIMSVKETAGHLIDGIEGRTRAYLQVQNGCDHRCTFCIIPFGRGNSRSVSAGEIVKSVNHIVRNGGKEVVLSGVDLTAWGKDLPGQPNLGNLVQRILKLCPDLPRLRLSSIDAVEIDDVLFELFSHEKRLMPHLHLSLQHGSDLILKRMKRRHLRQDAIELCNKIRAARPDIAFGADIIAGFPTETEEHFQDSLSLIDECGLSFIHVFPFSPRVGTPAQKMPQLPKALIKERAKALREKATAALSKLLDAQIGTIQQVLIEKDGIGRLGNFTPIKVNQAPDGEIIKAKIVSRDTAGLVGEILAHDKVS